ncbi:rubrerythrin-like domain-containing protein [Halomarina oriensis]|uniref:Rubrerythrin-like domain-containing protein n=1 Tax=Halomarina oriensis TaxID=671145 RepID=A0A6B0GEJ7_9EURY|nr:rubrerythrin-like domain-containing protein [Halomarina oriensis]MWG33232.1 rubrerythrin-like domain-containing protein [Halomarina oriensis]
MSHDSESGVREPPFTYECVDCGERHEADRQPVGCQECGGEMRNISVSSER